MPPKKNAGQNKTDQKKKEKVLEDKTFGMKNKKGKKQQQQIQQIKGQIQGNQKDRQKELDEKKKLQDAKKAQKDELNLLFRPTQTVAAGADPKSVLCSFFVQGTCQKGAKCKFSHDMSLANKSEKRSLYTDKRDADEAEKKPDEGMDSWDQNKLEEVINEKHGEKNTRQTSSQICKHFLKAVDKNVYGWFWECPNGGKCLYRHALPPGFILKRDVVKGEEKDELTIEELIDIERKKLGSNTTKVTLETFTAWKNKKLKEKKDKLIESTKKKKKDFKQGKLLGYSGREMFAYKPELAMDDDEEAEGTIEREAREEEEEEGEVHEVAEQVIDLGDVEMDDEEMTNGEQPGPSTEQYNNHHNHNSRDSNNVVINEELFVEEGLEDLDLDDSDSDD